MQILTLLVLLGIGLIDIHCPLTVTALNFAVIGDWGLGGYKGGVMSEIHSANSLNKVCAKLNCNFTLSVGDNIYVGNVLLGLKNSFEDMFNSPGPFFPCIGNHDNVGPQIQYSKTNGKRWKFPSNTYTYTMPIDDTGYTVQIFAVNTQDFSLAGGGQYAWLEEGLKKSTARWKIIFGHYPTMGSGRHKRVGSVSRIHVLMDKYNAQAYFSGHDHIVEMSNFGGRVLGISGGMTRGGMMLRGIGGKYRRFTLTQPSEYNPWVEDWPGHGFITVRLSPNVMNVQIWDNSDALQYDFSVTHDWMKVVKDMPAAVQHQWPSPDVVLQAYKDEAKLPKGTGEYQVFAPDGSMSGKEEQVAVPTSPPGAPTTPPPKAKQVIDKEAAATHTDGQKTDDTMQYSVSTECVTCDGKPTIGEFFTLYLSGLTVDSFSRLYLTSTPVGCEVRSKPEIVPGTTVISMNTNVLPFKVTGPATEVYVCYSADRGRTYRRLTRVDSIFGESGFVLASPSNSSQPQSNNRTSSPNSDTPELTPVLQTPSPGHSSMTLVLVALLSILGGTIGAVYLSNMKHRAQLLPSQSQAVEMETRT
eukprot:Tbor_TRINITY_DN5997_c0_g2::TRINITY_DN5997_c0_g2_i6::g.18975::m.18975/K14379/ACP5; tartrate-resistant acid phosphatase type 5